MITTNSTAQGDAGASSLTYSLTVNSGFARVLVTGVAMEFTARTITNVTYNGVALTSVNVASNNNEVRAYLWYMVNPPVGTANVVVTSDGVNNIRGFSRVYNNVAQTGTINASGSNNGPSSDASLTISPTVRNTMIVDCLSSGEDSGSITASGSQTVIYDNEGTPMDAGFSQKLATATGSNSMYWTISGGNRWAHVAIALKPYQFGGGGLLLL